MEMEDKVNEIAELERQIGELPVGYISRKNIHGKTRYSRQWTESGKIKSQYIKEEDLETVEEQIARRRELQQRLKELGKKTREPRRTGSGEGQKAGFDMAYAEMEFETNVLTGEELLAMARNIESDKKRDC